MFNLLKRWFGRKPAQTVPQRSAADHVRTVLIEEGYPATLVAQAVARAERLERFYSLPSEPSLGDNYEGIVFRTLAWARATRRMQL